MNILYNQKNIKNIKKLREGYLPFQLDAPLEVEA